MRVVSECVDVIVSEWMGFFGLHESMLNSVITARDRWLKEGGVILPSKCDIKVSLGSCPELWKSQIGWISSEVEGVDFSCLESHLSSAVRSQPVIETLQSHECTFATTALIKSLNLYTITHHDLSALHADITISCQHNAVAHAFVMWFDVTFTRPTTAPSLSNANRMDNAIRDGVSVVSSHSSNTDSIDDMMDVVLSTSPFTAETHWKQSLLLVPQPMPCLPGLTLECRVDMLRDIVNVRHYDVIIEVTEVGFDESYNDENTKSVTEKDI